jgi:osmotically-inducible protein OsmY
MSRVLVVCLLLTLAGCTPRDGDLLRKIVRKTGQKLQVTAAPLGQIKGAAGGLAPGMADLAARVSTRLRWDRYLADSRLEVRGQSSGTVVLSGTVADPSIKQRALDLAKSTVGVERVTDEVKVARDE